MKRYTIALCAVILFLSGTYVRSEVPFGSEYLGGESIYRLSLANPLGASGFKFALNSQFQQLEVDTSAFDLHFSLAYGVLPGLDFSFYLPYVRMTQGEYYKAGAGDAAVALKYIRTKPPIRPFSWGFQAYFLVPTGYQKDIYGFPGFSRNENGFGGRFIFQLESRTIDLVGNVGSTFTSKSTGDQFFLGGGARINLLGRLVRAAGEFATLKPHDGSDPTSFIFAGAETRLPYVGLEFKLGVESELGNDDPLKLVLGVSMTGRKTLPGVSKGILETKSYYNDIMVFEFLDEEENFIGEDVTGRLKRNLGSLANVKVMEQSLSLDYGNAVKDREKALQETQGSSADLLVFARYSDYGYKRTKGFNLPYLIAFPKTTAYISAEVWVIDTKSKKQIFTETVTGKATASRGIALFAVPGDNQDSFLNTSKKEQLRNDAIDSFIRNLSARFSYLLNR